MEIQHAAAPEAGKDYPRNWGEFLDWFATEEACRGYLEKLRWPRGFVCSSCGVAEEPYRSSRARLMCRSCGHQGTVTAGTIFDKTRTPLRAWLSGAWYVTNQKLGVSALGLKRVLGLGSYETAWTMLHRLRRAMVRPDRELLKGTVEVDETYLAISDRDAPVPKDQRKKRKNRTHQVLVVIAVELHEPRGFGRIRLRRIDNDSAAQVIPFVQANVEPGAQVRTDGSAAYRELKDLGYGHHRTVMLGSETPAHVSMAGVHRVASLIKRWILGAHHGSVQPAHLDAYLDEFVFRFNRRTSTDLARPAVLSPAAAGRADRSGDLRRRGPASTKGREGGVDLLDGHPASGAMVELSGYPLNIYSFRRTGRRLATAARGAPAPS